MADDRRYTAADVPVTAEDVAHRGFSTAFRGFDPNEVRLYLTRVAEWMRTARERQRELEQQLRDTEARAAKPQLDEATLTNALGEHTARIIRSAHEAAADIRARAEESVEQILKDAHEESSRLRADAERALAEQMGEAEGRRRVALAQVEQLQAGRDRLLEAYRVVRRTLDDATEALQRAEADARAAAEAAAHRVAAEPDPTPDELGIAPTPRPAPVEEDVSVQPRPETLEPTDTPGEPVYSRPPDTISSVRLLRSADEPATPPEPAADVRPSLKVVQTPSDVESVRVFRADSPPPPSPSPPPPEPPPPPPAEAEAMVDEPEPAEPEPAGPEARPEVGELFAKIRADQDAAETPPPSEAVSEDELVRRRDEVLAPIAAALIRKLKRALQDEQNEVLDRLRRHGGSRPSLAVAFPDGLDPRARYREAARPHLAEAVAAGGELAGEKNVDEAALAAVADELADALVAPLARRLEQALDEAASAGEDEGEVTGRVSAAYRDVKGSRLERLAADFLGNAYAAGAFVAWPPGTPLRWIVRDVDGQCPDCDDNALAGPTPRGEVFPTGQVRPPAHAGCRCLLAPASA